MDAFLGKWKRVPEATVGFAEYAEAMKFPEEVRKRMRDDKLTTVEMIRDGDTYTNVMDYVDRQDKLSFKLGERQTVNRNGIEVKLLFKLEGDRLITEHEARGQNSTTTRYVKANQLISETTGNGKTMTVVFERV